jgi:septum formation protein
MQVGLQFSVVVPAVDEAPVVNYGTPESIEEQVIALADAKIRAALARLPASDGAGGLVIGADTIVLIDGDVLGKPASADEARAMLGQLSGKTHEVYTGVVVLDRETGQRSAGAERTAVTFAPLTEEWIRRYVRTGEPMDKAGAYAVQGLGSIFIERIDGCYFNVVGLPLALLARLLREQGFDTVAAW